MASANTEVAIIGAGPYGLSVAAHLRSAGVDFRMFGKPMQSWAGHMPKGMFLKSEGFASDLYDPDGAFTLKSFCRESRLAYGDSNVPVALDTFVAYGRAFKRQLALNVDERMVVTLDRSADAFCLRLDDGEAVSARRVVVAVGHCHFRNVPETLARLPQDVVSHSSAHHDVSRFKGQSVSVIGGGSSALDLVAALHDAGADARLIARRPALKWNRPNPGPKRRWSPHSGLGGGWRNYFFEHAPMAFRVLPAKARFYVVGRWLGPAGGWPAKHSAEQAELLLGHDFRGAEHRDGRVYLNVVDREGNARDLPTDHVIAATGYKVDLRALSFLESGLRERIRSVENTPVLSQSFQSSIPELYFVGLAAANNFGPVMRFLLGARYTARRLTKRFRRGAAKPR